jgi:hypothetical protein
VHTTVATLPGDPASIHRRFTASLLAAGYGAVPEFSSPPFHEGSATGLASWRKGKTLVSLSLSSDSLSSSSDQNALTGADQDGGPSAFQNTPRNTAAPAAATRVVIHEVTVP